ncbi:hypothetical protein IMG5_145190 [Ichthyophthirius multifiliis]|uniref:Uncharacterized protein n=1 Tax=Ichthyophthirius multifiliis TaxID=5932 RepID=G0QXT9_ICHMU|nr:hypothetical protein IMG5_145190 [Ichthyophthirius multifiliis]EGR29970.1 hypothetical protein IMG5_145190 [Ichthyophthirius multifiliis]|eukprot:XP_004031206.1 hypothetical protein IMG5_145190 [Ichthyophthirius multifiliis]
MKKCQEYQLLWKDKDQLHIFYQVANHFCLIHCLQYQLKYPQAQCQNLMKSTYQVKYSQHHSIQYLNTYKTTNKGKYITKTTNKPVGTKFWTIYYQIHQQQLDMIRQQIVFSYITAISNPENIKQTKAWKNLIIFCKMSIQIRLNQNQKICIFPNLYKT